MLTFLSVAIVICGSFVLGRLYQYDFVGTQEGGMSELFTLLFSSYVGEVAGVLCALIVLFGIIALVS